MKKLLIAVLGVALYATAWGQVWEEWVATYNYGAPGNDAAIANDVAVDDGGFVYVTGISHYDNDDHSGDYATIKYDSNGNVQWIARYNGPGDMDDEPQASALDQRGNVYVAGESYGANFSLDICTIKYGPDGSELWVARYNGPANGPDMVYALVVDSIGNVYLAGCSDRDSSAAVNYDLLVLKYDPLGNQQWIVLLNGPGEADDKALDLALDNHGNINITGYYDSGPGYDCITAKFDQSGTLVWLDLLTGDTYVDVGDFICLDEAGYIYISGAAADYNGNWDMLTIKYNEAGEIQWIDRYGPLVGYDYWSEGLALNPQGGVHVCGVRVWDHYPYYTTNPVLIKYNYSGEQEWISYNQYYGAPEDIAVDSHGIAYVTGYQMQYTQNVTTQKYTSEGILSWTMTYYGTLYGIADAHAMALDRNGNLYIAGDTDLLPTPQYDIAFLTIKYTQTCPIDISITPTVPPIQIPPAGGSFNYNIGIANGAQSSQIFDTWIMLQLPGGSWHGPMLGPIALTLPGGGNITRLRTQNVPGRAPAGTYTYRGYVGDYPAMWDSSSFTFEKLGAGGLGLGAGNWDNTGEAFRDEAAFITHNSSLIISCAPNPFNPTTVLSYQLPVASQVRLNVYDLSGRLVAELVNGLRDAGVHQVTWDASGLPSGLYFCRIEAGSFRDVIKMMLVK